MWLSAKFWGEGIVNNSHVMGMAQGLAPRDKVATVGDILAWKDAI